MNKKWPSCLLSTFFVFFLLGLGMVLIIILGKKTGEFDINLLRSNKTGIINLQILPKGSEVYIDGQTMGVTPIELTLKTGTHQVKVINKPYIPFETNITIRPGKVTVLDNKLKFVPTAKLISEDAAYPSWTLDNNLFYYQNNTGDVHSYSEIDEIIFENPEYLLDMTFSPDGTYSIANAYPGLIPSLDLYHLNDGFIKEVAIGECPVLWKKDNTILTYCWVTESGDPTDENLKLWYGNPTQPLTAYKSEKLDSVFPVDRMEASADGKFVSFLSGEVLSIWMINGQELTSYKTISSVQSAAWDPSTPDRLAYVDQNNDLYLFTPNKLIKSKEVNKPIQWIPNSNYLIYPIYNSTDGGSSFWKLDIVDGSKEILVDPQIARGRVEFFTVSDDGSQIAYTTDQSHLWIVSIGE